MKPGPAPKPRKLKELNGNAGKHKLNDKAPKPDKLTKMPKPPGFMDYYAKKEWKRAGQHLINIGVLTKIDISLFMEYCQVHAHCIRLHKKIKEEGYRFKTDKGYEQRKPYTSILKDMQKEKRQLARHLGLSPSARTDIEIDMSDDKDNVNELLNDDIRKN